MQTFSALFSGVRDAAGAGRSRDASPSTSTSSDTNGNAGGFDRMLQSHARNGSNDSSRTIDPATRRATTQGAAEASTKPRGSDGGRGSADETKSSGQTRESNSRDSKTHESRADDAKPREGERVSGDEAGNETGNDAGDPASSGDTASAAATDTGNATPAASDAAPATLPEQLLALLNGLAAAPAATATDPSATMPAAMTGEAATAATSTKAPMLPLQLQPGALQNATTQATPDASGATGSAFAMAMGALAGADAEGADTAPDLAATLGDIEPATLPSSATLPTAATAAKVAAPAAAMQSPVAMDANFDDGFGSRIAWMAEQRVGHAEIRVSPDHLGTIDVRLQLDGTKVNAEFHSAQPDVRHALESSLPRLREMLGQSGLQLGQADVGQRHGGGQPSSGSATANADRGDGTVDANWTPGPAARASRGLLDEYA